MQKPLTEQSHFPSIHTDTEQVSWPNWSALLSQLRTIAGEYLSSPRIPMHLLMIFLIGGIVTASQMSLPQGELSLPQYNRPELPTPTVQTQRIERPAPLTLPDSLRDYSSGILRLGLVRTIIPDRSVPEVEVAPAIKTYVVDSGDTIYDIALTFGLSPETIMWANKSLEDNPDLLSLGQEIVILPVDGVYHQVASSDTLEGIASTFKVNVESIVNYPLNELDPDNALIFPGQWIIVPGGIKPYQPKYVSVAIANAPAGAQSGTGAFQWPASGNISQDYWSRHRALDIEGWIGAPVYAADSGYVTSAQWDDSGYGRIVIIDHGNGFKTLYAHLHSFYIAVGDEIVQGQQIAEMGSTGNSTGPHLHFEVIKDGVQRNPWGFLP